MPAATMKYAIEPIARVAAPPSKPNGGGIEPGGEVGDPGELPDGVGVVVACVWLEYGVITGTLRCVEVVVPIRVVRV
jgi:hypothetical protein